MTPRNIFGKRKDSDGDGRGVDAQAGANPTGASNGAPAGVSRAAFAEAGAEAPDENDRTDPMMAAGTPSARKDAGDGWITLHETHAGTVTKFVGIAASKDSAAESVNTGHCRWIAGALCGDRVAALKEKLVELESQVVPTGEYTEVDGKFAVTLACKLTKLADYIATAELRPAEIVQMVVDLAALVQDTSRLDLLPVSFDAGRLFATRIGIGVAEKAAAFRVRYAVLDELASVDDARTMIPALLSQILTLGIELLNREWRAPWHAASAETWASAFETMRDSAAVADASLFLTTVLSLVPEPVLHLATDVGMVRKGNEDFGRIAVDHSTRPGASAVQAWVADGMGGHAAGEVASRLAVASLERTLRDWRESVAAGGNVLRSHIERAFARANTAIFRDMEMNPSRRGMGTTLTGILALSPHPAPDPGATRAGAFDAARVWCANIGDSRTYLVSGSTLVRLSRDHSFVQSLVDAGEITEDEAFHHPAKNVIARCLGGQGEIDGTPDICTLAAGSGDLFLIASDGLTDLIEDSDILEIMKLNWDAAEPSLPLVAQALIDAANDEGGKDNITVALVYFA